MNWIIRMYNQNRNIIFLVIIAVIFIIILIQGINYLSTRQLEENNREQEDIAMEPDEVYNKNVSALYGENAAPTNDAENYNNILDTFLTYCLNGDIANAYSLLSDVCKEELYPSQQVFEQQYYENIFDKNKIYDYQYWAGKTYQVTISDDILKTGGTGTKIRDYYTIVREENNNFKLNINGFIGKTEINSTEEDEGIKVTVKNLLQYNNYAIYEINIKNNTDKTILLDSQTNSNSIYAVNHTGDEAVNLRAYTEDINPEDLIVLSKGEKTLKIRFNTNYSSTINVNTIVFSNVVMNYDDYKVNNENYINNVIRIAVDN